MHATLSPRTNIMAIAVSASVAFIALMLSRPIPLVPEAAGAGVGILVGIFQGRGLRRSADRLLHVETALDIRRVLMSTPSGKASIYLQWAGAFLVLYLSFWVGSPVGGAFGGYAALMCVRDLTAFPAVISLGSNTGAAEQRVAADGREAKRP